MVLIAKRNAPKADMAGIAFISVNVKMAPNANQQQDSVFVHLDIMEDTATNLAIRDILAWNVPVNVCVPTALNAIT